MTEDERNSGRTQASRILSNIDKIAKNLYNELNEDKDKVRISMWSILDASDVSRSTFYHINYPTKLDSYTGTSYSQGKLTLNPEKWLRYRGKLEELQ